MKNLSDIHVTFLGTVFLLSRTIMFVSGIYFATQIYSESWGLSSAILMATIIICSFGFNLNSSN